jgi:hypothetical protein
MNVCVQTIVLLDRTQIYIYIWLKLCMRFIPEKRRAQKFYIFITCPETIKWK